MAVLRKLHKADIKVDCMKPWEDALEMEALIKKDSDCFKEYRTAKLKMKSFII
ncbi:MAG: hypothetical protein ACLRMX_02950 [Lachnospira eligens]